MRESQRQHGSASIDQSEHLKESEIEQQSGHETAFFASFFRASIRDGLADRQTIGGVSDIEARFHYNAVENSIITALAKFEPPPPMQLVEAWKALRLREGRRLLDIGPGAGHWIDFMRDVFYVAECIGVEMTAQVAEVLNQKYRDDSSISIVQRDIADPGFSVDMINGPVDYVTVIGVMFHIISDERWEQAIENLAKALKPGGKLIVNGDFGAVTESREAVKTVQFEDWNEFSQAQSSESEREFVTRRVRSLPHWLRVVSRHGLQLADLVRTQSDPNISTPENDVLLLIRE